jgi:hypothetical protein
MACSGTALLFTQYQLNLVVNVWRRTYLDTTLRADIFPLSHFVAEVSYTNCEVHSDKKLTSIWPSSWTLNCLSWYKLINVPKELTASIIKVVMTTVNFGTTSSDFLSSSIKPEKMDRGIRCTGWWEEIRRQVKPTQIKALKYFVRKLLKYCLSLSV